MTLDDCTYQAKIEKIHLDKYKYEDKNRKVLTYQERELVEQ